MGRCQPTPVHDFRRTRTRDKVRWLVRQHSMLTGKPNTNGRYAHRQSGVNPHLHRHTAGAGRTMIFTPAYTAGTAVAPVADYLEWLHHGSA